MSNRKVPSNDGGGGVGGDLPRLLSSEQKKNVWQYFVSSVAIVGPATYGVLYVAGRARYEGYVREWGLPPELFKLSSTDLIYNGFEAESHLASFFDGLYGQFVLIAAVALLSLACLTIMLVATRFVDGVKAKLQRGQGLRQPSSESKVKVPDHWSEPGFKFIVTLLWITIAAFIGLAAGGLLALFGMRLVAEKHRDAGRLFARELKELYAKADTEACDPIECPIPPLNEISFTEAGEVRRVQARIVACSDKWCGYRLRIPARLVTCSGRC